MLTFKLLISKLAFTTILNLQQSCFFLTYEPYYREMLSFE